MPGISTVDWTVIAVYLAVVGLIGFRFVSRQKSTRDYFLGGRSLPWWAASLSIIATETSAVTFIGIPRIAFTEDWSPLQLVLGFVCGRLFLAFIFVPTFYRRDYLTVYGFLAQRFGAASRRSAAILFLLGRLVASGVRLFAGCLAFQVATGGDIRWVILGLGVFGTLFTLAGGIRAVVWTDVVLGLTLVAGGVLSACFLLDAVPGGLPGILGSAELSEKVAMFHPFRSFADSDSFVAGIVGGFVLTLATHGTDQDIVQRMLTCRDARGGGLSLIGSAILIVPLFILFLFVGTCLYFFHQTGTPSYAVPENLDHIFPLFIARELPVGLSGLVLAGLLAAALSSFTSVLNALASTTIGDFYRPFRERRGKVDETHYVRASRLVTALWGIALIITALAFVGSQKSVFKLALQVFTYFYGAFLGAFLLGILTRQGSDRSVLTGMLASVPAILVLGLRQFLAEPENAPGVLQGWLGSLSPETTNWLLTVIPDIAWPYWILIGTAISMGVGALGSRRGSLESPGGECPISNKESRTTT